MSGRETVLDADGRAAALTATRGQRVAAMRGEKDLLRRG